MLPLKFNHGGEECLLDMLLGHIRRKREKKEKRRRNKEKNIIQTFFIFSYAILRNKNKL
jgi:hypothetical protein